MMFFTYGFLVALLSSIPFSFFDLDRSVYLTIGAAFLSLLIVGQWFSAAAISGLKSERMPVFTNLGFSYVQTIGTVLMNLGCSTVIPSWVNIKAMHIRTQYDI
jgi:hypothetical protein